MPGRALGAAQPPATVWNQAAAHPTLGAGDVHVWRASIERPGELPALAGLLAADERARAARFRFGRDRDRFSAAHGLLRLLLGRYLGREPAAIEFGVGRWGKPVLTAGGDDGLRFNLAHAGEIALVAVARGREVGVDVERLRRDVDVGAIAAGFAPGERAALAATPAERRLAAFFALWTHKEAYAKGIGRGLSLPLDRYEVVFPADPASPAAVAGVPGWSLRPLDAGPDYAAAVAAEGRGWALARWEWPAAGLGAESVPSPPPERVGRP